MEIYSEFQLIVYLSDHNFTVLVHSQRSHNVVFSCAQPAQQEKTADRLSQRAAGEHSGAFSS